jgi:bifunctional oligoribonuclease and PAP phosphatase NrnA
LLTERPLAGGLAPSIEEEPLVVAQIAHILLVNDDFLIVGHLRPDGDCLGSCLGLLGVLAQMGKRARFFTAGPVPDYFSYLPYFDRIETTLPKDCSGPVLCVDSADTRRICDGFSPAGIVVNIDHHISNTNYGTLNWVDPQATAAAEQIYRLAVSMEQPISAEIATCLFTGIMTDTGGFRFANTGTTTFRVASHLVEAGANPAAIAEAVWDSRKADAVKLTGQVFASLKYEFDGRFVWNEITREMFESAGGDQSEPEGLSSELRSILGVEISTLFYETPEGFCRIGFRSRGRVDVAELAGLIGGGGHRAASGAVIREPFGQARERALTAIRAYLDQAFSH